MGSSSTRWIWPWIAALVLATTAGAGAFGDNRPVELYLVPPGVITADGSGQLLTFVVLDQSGKLAEEAKFNGTAVELGKLTGWEHTVPGIWTCVYETPHSSQLREVPLTIKVKVGKDVVRQDTTLSLRAPAPASLEITLGAAQLIKAVDRELELRIQVTATDDMPMDGRDLQVGARIGTVDGLTAKGGGLYTARYTAPVGEPTPELDFVHVIDRAHPHDLVDFAVVPLAGNLEWDLDVGMANLSVALDVGDKRYGPGISNDQGMAKIPIVVPPGITDAVAAVEVPGSPTIYQAVELGLPMYNQLAMAATAEYAPGDGTTSYPIYLYVTDPAGRPSNNAPVTVTASAGSVVNPDKGAGGLYVARYTPPAVDEPTEVTLTAAITGHEPSGDSISLQVVPALPSAFTAGLQPSAVGPGEATITVGGQITPPSGASGEVYGVAVVAASGALDVSPDGAGGHAATHTDTFDASRAYLVGATMTALDRPAQTLVAWLVDEQIRANRHTTIVAMVLDRYGLPVTGVELSARAKGGGARVSGGGVTDERGRVTFGVDAGPLGGLSMIEVADSRGTLRMSLPLWQTADDPDRFEFPRTGGAERLDALDTWAPLMHRLYAGPGAFAPPPAE